MKVLVVGSLHPEGLALLQDSADITQTPSPSDADLADAEVLVIRSDFRVDETLLARAPRLRTVGRPGSGLDRVDLDACHRRGIDVLSTPEAVAPAVAELALGMMLLLSRRLGMALQGRVLGLFGFGHAGRALAPKAAAFGMRILAHDPYWTDAEIRQRGAQPVAFEDLLAGSDVLSLHAPLTAKTLNLFDGKVLARMKPGALLLNCARGGIVNETALAAALKAGRPAAAALDVFAQEPPQAGHPLLGLANVLLTPHIGAATAEAQARSARALALALLAGKPASRGL